MFTEHMEKCQICNGENLCSVGEAIMEEEERLERMEQEYYHEISYSPFEDSPEYHESFVC